jgi:hypothetical protein
MKYSITSKKKKWLVKNAVAICECLHEIKQKTYNIVDHPSKICVTKMPAVILVTPTNNRVFDPRVYYRQELYIAFIRIGVHYIYTFKPALRRHIWDK